jgi:hypothetical protein
MARIALLKTITSRAIKTTGTLIVNAQCFGHATCLSVCLSLCQSIVCSHLSVTVTPACLVCCCSYYQYVCLPPCLLSFCQALVCLSVILSILLLFCLPLAVCRLLCLSFTFSLTYHACRFPAYTSISVYYLGLSLSSDPSFCYSPFYLSCLLLSCLSVRLPAVLTICVSVMLLVCLSAILSIL